MAVNDIIGNAVLKKKILSLSKSGRPGTAYLFSGEPGTGKRFAAIQMAKTLNCLFPLKDGGCCDKCENCTHIDKIFTDLDEDGMQKHPHPDCLYINTQKAQLVIDMVLGKLNEINAYKPVKLKKKIVIINDSDKMNNVAANAILKELEEPNEAACIMLIADSVNKILPTIVSRCQRLDVARASEEEVVALTLKLMPSWDREKCAAAAAFSEGRIEAALSYDSFKPVIDAAKSIFLAVSGANDNIEAIFKKIEELEGMKKSVKSIKKKGENSENEGKEPNFRLFLLEILKVLSYIYKNIMLDELSLKRDALAKFGIKAGMYRPLGLKKAVAILSLVEKAQRELMENANTSLLLTELLFGIRKEGLSND